MQGAYNPKQKQGRQEALRDPEPTLCWGGVGDGLYGSVTASLPSRGSQGPGTDRQCSEPQGRGRDKDIYRTHQAPRAAPAVPSCLLPGCLRGPGSCQKQQHVCDRSVSLVVYFCLIRSLGGPYEQGPRWFCLPRDRGELAMCWRDGRVDE